MFIDRRPNAVIVAGAMYIALTVVIITAIANSYSQLGQGLLGVAVYGLMGVILLGIALLTMHLLIPGVSTSTSTSRCCIPARLRWR